MQLAIQFKGDHVNDCMVSTHVIVSPLFVEECLPVDSKGHYLVAEFLSGNNVHS